MLINLIVMMDFILLLDYIRYGDVTHEWIKPPFLIIYTDTVKCIKKRNTSTQFITCIIKSFYIDKELQYINVYKHVAMMLLYL